jgi:hypothetical protein
MTVRVELDDSARAEALDVATHYQDQRSGLGDDFLEELDRALAAIGANPRAWAKWPGREAKKLGVRRYVMDRYPFTLPFVVSEELVTVLAVAHTSRRPGYWLKRLTSATRPTPAR